MRYNVKLEFGAVGDGLVNDAPAIQAAIDSAANAGGGVVFLPIGTYLLDRPRPLPDTLFSLVRLRSNVSIQGEHSYKTMVIVAPGLNGSQTALHKPEAWSFAQYHVFTPGPIVGVTGTESISNCTFSRFTIDHNGINNSFGPAPEGATVRCGHYNWGIGFRGQARNIVIDEVIFLNNPGSQNVACMPVDRAEFAANVVVKNCTFKNVADSVPGSNALDHSSVFLMAQDWRVSGCLFLNETSSKISTAAEVHGGPGSAAGNRIDNFDIGFNLVANYRDMDRVVIKNNRVKNARIGLCLWTWSANKETGRLTNTTLKNVCIDRNVIILRTDSRNAGIQRSAPETCQVAPLNLAITDNLISTTGSIEGLHLVASGILLNRGEDVNIDGNRIFNMTGRGISLYGETTWLRIANNVITDVGLGVNPYDASRPRAYAQGIAIQMGGEGYAGGRDIVITGNTIENVTGDSIVKGILIAGDVADVDVLGNTLHVPS